MLVLVIEINTDLAAFHDDPYEVERLMVRSVHEAMNSPSVAPYGLVVYLRDSNGNTAGIATLTEEKRTDVEHT